MKTFTFVSRTFDSNGANITREQFIQMLIEDINTAKIEFRKHSDLRAEEDYQRDIQSYKERRERQIERIIEKSYMKYKRESNRIAWVERESAKIPETIERNPYYHYGSDMESIAWDIKPWENGCSIVSVYSNEQPIAIDDVKFTDRFGRLYDEAINNKYFRGAIGWSFVGDRSAELKLTLTEELQQEWTADVSNLTKAIMDFYATCSYCGD